MENPREDVKEVILGLLDRPTLKRQADTLKKYCLPDVDFYYPYFNTRGLKEMTVIHQVAQILANYQGVKLEQVSYDEKMNLVNIWTTVMIRPWPLYWNGPIPLSIFTVCELQDVEVKGKGKRAPRTIKMIKSQRDWFEFSPLIRVIPIVGNIYANQDLRFAIGNIVAETVMVGLQFLEFILPSKIKKPIFG